MASKGPKNGTAKPAASKSGARPKAAPKPVVAAAVEKPAPVAKEELVAPPVVIEPVPVVEAASQEVEVLAEPVTEAVETAVEQAPVIVEETIETIVEAAEPVLETVNAAAAPEAVAATVKEPIMETIETNVAKAQAFFADFNERAKAAVEKSTALVTEANEFAKGNLEAVVESSKIAAKGLETLGQDAAEYSRKSFESATAALKSMSAVKSPTELFKLQGDFFKTSFDSYVAEASKGTEALIKLASDAAQPLSNRVAVAAEKVKLAA